MAYIIAITEVFDTFHCINKLVFMQGKRKIMKKDMFSRTAMMLTIIRYLSTIDILRTVTSCVSIHYTS